MGWWRERLGEGLDALDRRVLPALQAWSGVDVDAERGRLRSAGWPFVDPEGLAVAPRHVAATAERVVDAACRTVGGAGAVTGLAGAAGIVPEAALWSVEVVRLAQRLAIVHGIDPRTPRGSLVVRRAVVAALGLPAGLGVGEGVVDARLSSLVRRDSASAALVRGAVRVAAWGTGRRAGRWIPGIGAASGAVDAPRRLRAAAAAMAEVVEMASAGARSAAITDVEELGGTR